MTISDIIDSIALWALVGWLLWASIDARRGHHR